MSASACNMMDIETFNKIAPALPPDISVLVRGPTGVGKSHIVAAIAKKHNLPVIDVRGSTMDESKVTGIPDFEAGRQFKQATYLLPSWYMRAAKEPVLLFLDEMNRAQPQVLQAFFQIVLDRCLGNDIHGNPLPLHSETRVYAAVNFGNEYDVVEMDPALLRRFWTVDIEPNVIQWCKWATEKGLSAVLVDFIRQHPVHWRVDPASGKVSPGQVLPTPASWHRFDSACKFMGRELDSLTGAAESGKLIHSIARGFVGNEAASAFAHFMEKYDVIISAEDLLAGKVDEKKLKALRQSDISTLIDKVAIDCAKRRWSKKEIENLHKWYHMLPGEQQFVLFNKVLNSNNMDNINPFHAPIGPEIVKRINEAKAKSNPGKSA